MRTGHLIECVTSDGYRVYPTFQFDENGEVFAGVSEVSQRFVAIRLVGGWTVAQWLCVPNPSFLMRPRRSSGLRVVGTQSPSYVRRDVTQRAWGASKGPDCGPDK